MKIISYNLNGIRATFKKGLIDWLQQEEPDILCVQETKAQPDQIETAEFEKLGYHHYWFSAQKRGYSGVGILSKEKPDKVVYGMDMEQYDNEGRLLRVDIGDVTFVSAYHPSGTSGDERQAFKMQWLDDFLNYVENLRKERPQLVLCGDYNIAHTEIDIYNPVGNKNNSGFLPEERAWIDKLIAHGYCDSFRYLNPGKEKYSWWSYRYNARRKNIGWRIDYQFVTENLKPKLVAADCLNEVYHSDHCPIVLELDV